MSGIYIHIPFCKFACHYCNFHFSTSLRYKNELVSALLKEIDLQAKNFDAGMVETIYLGGGTPSLLSMDELRSILDKVHQTFSISPDPEITLEANPDDILPGTARDWSGIGINRLSIGIQSFYEEDLRWMNRAHDARQAQSCIHSILPYFNNFSIDLIYGTPGLTDERWKQNVEKAISLNIPHLSCYALTVEPKTPLDKMIRTHKTPDVDPDMQSNQFLLLMEWLEPAGYEHYEISNFAKPGFRSRHNSSYWQGKPYLGIGPSAHSFDGTSRWWNVSNNNKYIESIKRGELPFEKEVLTPVQKLNENIMISLRTSEGLDLSKLSRDENLRIKKDSEKYILQGLMKLEEERLVLTRQGKLRADGIAADLFVV